MKRTRFSEEQIIGIRHVHAAELEGWPREPYPQNGALAD